MLVTSIEENVGTLDPHLVEGLHVERVVLPLQALDRRMQRVTSDHGTDIGIQLAPGGKLHDGDVLHRDAHGLVVVAVETSDVLLIAPDSIEQMGVVAHALGNRHLPAQFFGPDEHFAALPEHDGVMVIQYDHTAEHYLQHVGVPHVRADQAMRVPFRHAEHTH